MAKLKNFVKFNPVILWLYRFCGAIFVKCLKIFVPINKKKILFMSFGGKRFDDSPMVLYNRIKNDADFADYELVWGFINPKDFDTGCKKVKTDTVKYYIEALSAGIWISNSSLERGLHFKRKGNIEINTWHGTPLKKLGCDIEKERGYVNKKLSSADLFCAQSEFDRDIWVRIFKTQKDKIIISDLPRNDVLTDKAAFNVAQIKNKLNISPDKKVLLYAPTFREYDRTSSGACFIAPPIDKEKWKRAFAKDYIVLVRAHYETTKIMGIDSDEFFINVSDYPNLNELIAVSDALISDYSSIYFDYAITEKPMFNYSYDFEEYEKFRGLYYKPADIFPCRMNLTEEELIDDILSFDADKYVEKVKKFKERFTPNAGHASEIVTEKLKEMIKERR